MSLATNINVNATFTQSIKDATDIVTATFPISENISLAMSSGTGSGNADRVHQDSQSALVASGTKDYDLSASLTDRFGDVNTFVTVKGILLINKSAGSNSSVINLSGNFVTTAFGASASVNIDAGTSGNPGFFLWTSPASGEAVTNTSADIVTITNNDASNTASYDIIIWGTSA